METKSNRNVILIGVIAILLYIAVGFTFASYMVSVSVSGVGSNVSKTTNNSLLNVKYNAGTSAFTFANAYPGKTSAAKNFSITVTPGTDFKSATYAIMLNISSNTFVKCTSSNYNATTNACTTNAEELKYTLKNVDTNTTLATGNLTGVTTNVQLIKETKSVTAATTYNYSLEISFVDTNKDQNHNQNKSLSGSISVQFAQ